MEVYTQQVALEQLKVENKDKARLAQKLAELEVKSLLSQTMCWPLSAKLYAFLCLLQLFAGSTVCDARTCHADNRHLSAQALCAVAWAQEPKDFAVVSVTQFLIIRKLLFSSNLAYGPFWQSLLKTAVCCCRTHLLSIRSWQRWQG